LVFAGILLASTISYCIWFLVVQKENLSKLFIVKFSEPLFAALFGAVLLGEDIFCWRYLVAFLLISGSVVIANMKQGEKK
jgi:drug/metabolite transporter (DMT)-like permease